jgi:hypothetical protein
MKCYPPAIWRECWFEIAIGKQQRSLVRPIRAYKVHREERVATAEKDQTLSVWRESRVRIHRLAKRQLAYMRPVNIHNVYISTTVPTSLKCQLPAIG